MCMVGERCALHFRYISDSLMLVATCGVLSNACMCVYMLIEWLPVCSYIHDCVLLHECQILYIVGFHTVIDCALHDVCTVNYDATEWKMCILSKE